MEILKLIIKILAGIIGCLTALMSILLFIQLSWPAAALWIAKLFASALSPLFVLMGIMICIVGLTSRSVFISSLGIYIVLVFFIHIIRVTRPPDVATGFENAFGADWESRINPEWKNKFLSNRLILKLPTVPEPRLEQNITFATIPGTDRRLLCDAWQPPATVTPSGLTFIYVHGGTWYLLDKDLGTRPFFKHLAAQGHVIIDVANRLATETDMMGMVADVKRAIFWTKENSATYGIDPDRVVVGGGSSGANLALLAAFTANDTQFTPKDLEGKDLSVNGVISIYGPTDLEAMYYHTNQHITSRKASGSDKEDVPVQMPEWVIKKMGKDYYRFNMDKGFANAGSFVSLFGGHPDERPDAYALFSPVTHVHSGCPPTLLIHGTHDAFVPVKTVRTLYSRLRDKNVAVVMHIIPQTDHAFDLIMPRLSPSAHNAIYEVERFLAIQVNNSKSSN